MTFQAGNFTVLFGRESEISSRTSATFLKRKANGNSRGAHYPARPNVRIESEGKTPPPELANLYVAQFRLRLETRQRTWTKTDGTKIRGAWGGHSAAAVRIKTRGGAETIPPAKLIASDRDYLRQIDWTAAEMKRSAKP